MIVKILSILTLLSVFFFPWPVTMLVALGVSVFEPLVPLAAGLLVDVLYFQVHGFSLPVFTLLGAGLSIAAWLVRGRLKTGSIRE